MSDLSNRLKQSLESSEINHKFLQLLNTNRNIDSLKDREIIPSISLSAFNNINNTNNNQIVLPSIHVQKQKIGILGATTKIRSMSQSKIKIKNIGEGTGIVGLASRGSQRQEGYLGPVNSMKNLIKIRNKSVESAQKSRNREQSLTKKLKSNKKQQLQAQQQPSFQVPAFKSTIQPQIITPQKLKLDFPNTHTNTNTTKNTKLLTNNTNPNKTIQQISNDAIDNLMLNIKFGKIQENISYRTYMKRELVQPTPAEIVKKLEEWTNKYKIKSALVYTKNLHAIFSKKCIANNTILSEFTNYSQIYKELLPIMSGLQYYPQNNKEKGRNLAARKIQSLFRMNFDIKYTKKLKSLMNKVKTIQRYWRVSLAYRRNREHFMKRISQKIQKVKIFTNAMVKNWQFIRSSPRVEVHICSIALEEFKRLSIQDLKEKELAQLTRIFRAAQPDCTVIYVTPFNFSGEIVRYYERIFEFGKKADAFRDRLYLINVESSLNRISPYLTTVSALLYDHCSLQKIKQIIKDRQTPVMGTTCAYIIPSYPSNQYTNLASELQIPIFSGPQSLHHLHSTKSGHYELLKPLLQSLGQKCPFSLPKTVHGIYSEKQMITILAVLIYKNKEIKKWMFKIDDEVEGRGIAVLNVDSFGFLRQLRNQDREEGNEGEVEDQDVIGLIADQLKQKLKIRLKILHKQIYPDYSTYLSHFLTRGGFLQACIEPHTSHGKTSRPLQHSISFKIEPNGQFQLLATYSRLYMGYKGIAAAVECPSEVGVEVVDNEQAVRALYRYLWGKLRLFGYFTVDFLVVRGGKQEDKDKQEENDAKKYIIGLDCFLNEKTSSILVPILTSQCEYNKQRNKFERKDLTAKLQDPFNLTSRINTQRSSITSSRGTENPKQLHPPQPKQLSFLYCPLLHLPNLPPIPQYFKLCKFNNISFDIQIKIGTLFLLQGGLENGCLGFLCSGESRDGMRQEGLRLVEFLGREFREIGVGKGKGKGKGKKEQRGLKAKNSGDQVGLLRGYLLNCIRKNSMVANYRKQDLNLQMIF